MKDNFYGFAYYAPTYAYDWINAYWFDMGGSEMKRDENNNIVFAPLGRQKHWTEPTGRIYEILNYICEYDPDDYESTSEYFKGLENY